MKASVVLLAVVTVLASCGGGGDGGEGGRTEDERAHAERMIRTGLPKSVKRTTGEAVIVSDVSCVRESESGTERKFDCVATVGGVGAEGIEYVDVPISVTCDDRKCIWRATE